MKLSDCHLGRQVKIACAYNRSNAQGAIVAVNGKMVTVQREDGKEFTVSHLRVKEIG